MHGGNGFANYHLNNFFVLIQLKKAVKKVFNESVQISRIEGQQTNSSNDSFSDLVVVNNSLLMYQHLVQTHRHQPKENLQTHKNTVKISDCLVNSS